MLVAALFALVASSLFPFDGGPTSRPEPVLPSPVLTSLTPDGIGVGAPQLPITLEGTGFASGIVILIGTQTLTPTSITPTQLQATIPGSMLTQSVSRSVRVRLGSDTSNSLTLTIHDPDLTSIDPSVVLVGSPSLTLQFTGNWFLPGSVVTIGPLVLTPTWIDASHGTCVVPQSELQSRRTLNVRVDNLPGASGGLSNSRSLEVVDMLLTALSPATGQYQGPTFQLTATGSTFGPNARLRWDRRDLMPTVSVTPTTLVASVDASYVNRLGTVDVDVVDGSMASNDLRYTVDYPMPTVTALTPASALATDGGGQSQVLLTVGGSGFAQGSRIFWGTSARSTTVLDENTATCSIPGSLLQDAGYVDVTVENPALAGPLRSNAVPFRIDNPVPAIGVLSPTDLPSGSAQLLLTISGTTLPGTGFNRQTTVTLDGVPLTVDTVNSGTIRVFVPASSMVSARMATLQATNPAPGGGSSSVQVAVTNAVPAVASLSPDRVDIGAATLLLDVIGPAVGANFNAQSVVRWEGNNLTTTQVGPNVLRATVDAWRLVTARFVSVSVFNPAPGGGSSFGLTFTVANPQASVTQVVPSTAATGAAQTTVTIHGSAFVAGCRARFNGEDLTTTFVSAGQVTAAIEPQQLWFGGQYAVQVLNPVPGGGAANSVPFTVVNPSPAINAVAPNAIAAGSATTTITVTGSNFVRQSLVTIDGVGDTTTFVDAQTLRRDVPAAQLAVGARLSIRVATPSPGGGTTAVRFVDVVNPVPAIASISPAVTPRDPAVPLSVFGSGFTSQSRLILVSPTRPAGFNLVPFSYSPNRLDALVPPGTFAVESATVEVFTPAPGGGSSQRLPMVFTETPLEVVDTSPVTFSVNGPVDAQTEGLRWPRGINLPSTPYSARLPAVPPAVGRMTDQPGDVQDYVLAAPRAPSEAELFQSEPAAGGGRPAGTNNQILVADALGLVAGTPTAAWRDNVNGVSFGEDHFGVLGVALGSGAPPSGLTTPWGSRHSSFLPNVVTLDGGTSFRFSVNPFARGLPRTGVAIESLRFDGGAGIGPWSSAGGAAAEVFGTPVLLQPGAPPEGTNTLVHDRIALALADVAAGALGVEDDLDALECIGLNEPMTWFGALPPTFAAGDLHSRTVPVGMHGSYDLAPPGMSVHAIAPAGMVSAPVFFTVDRRSTGRALSAVRTQWRLGQAAGDVFMAYGDSNLLLIDEEEAGLYGGAPGLPTDDMDALLLNVHPDDRYYLLELAFVHVPYSGLVTEVDPDGIGGSGDEYREGPGYTYSLLRFAATQSMPRLLRIRLGFSVSTDSIGLEGTPVDFEAGLDPSGAMQQAGDVFFTQFGDFGDGLGIINPAPVIAETGTHYRWYEENQIGLESGSWVLGSSTNFAALPDELNALDSFPLAPGCPGLIGYYGSGCQGTGLIVPDLSATGCPSAGWSTAFGVSSGVGGAPCILLLGIKAIDVPFLPGANLLVDPGMGSQTMFSFLTGSGPGNGTMTMSFRIPPGLEGGEIAWQAGVFDAASPNGLVATTRGTLMRVQ